MKICFLAGNYFCYITKVSRKVQRLESEESLTNTLSTSAQQVNMEKKLEKQMYQISDPLFEVCIDVILGDASIQRNTSKKIEKYRLKFLQSAKHEKYVFHLHEIFKDYVVSQPYFNEKRNTFSFQTVFHSDFNKVAHIFLDKKDNKKIISDFFTIYPISPISLAYWFMDDGGLLSYNKDYIRKSLVFNTQGFSFNEVNVLSENLNTTYNLETWVKLNKNKPIIAVSGKKYTQIKNLISPYIIPSMKYKLPL